MDNARPWRLDFETEEDSAKRPMEAELQRLLTVTQDHELAMRKLGAATASGASVARRSDWRTSCVRVDARSGTCGWFLRLIDACA